jgi:hypothetical protein
MAASMIPESGFTTVRPHVIQSAKVPTQGGMHAETICSAASETLAGSARNETDGSIC